MKAILLKTILLISFFCGQQAFADIIIPFTKKGELMVIKLGINGNPNAFFVFDTGASTTVIDSAAAVKLGLKATTISINASATGTSTFKALSNQEINIADQLNIVSRNMVIVDLKPLKEIIGIDFDGIVGYDLLSKFIVSIDFDKNEILLSDKIDPLAVKDYRILPFSFTNGIQIPQFDISIKLNDGSTYSGLVLFDSGAGLTLAINTPFINKNNLLEKVGKTITTKSRDLTQETRSAETSISSLTIAGFEFEGLPVNLSSDKKGVKSYGGYLGILGIKIIQHFNIVIDYSQKRLYLKPNYQFKEPFDFPLVGFKLKKVNDEVFIANVIDKTEAAVKGIKVNQKVISIDGVKSNDLEDYRKLLKQEGKEIQLKIMDSNGEIFTVNLSLKRMI